MAKIAISCLFIIRNILNIMMLSWLSYQEISINKTCLKVPWQLIDIIYWCILQSWHAFPLCTWRKFLIKLLTKYLYITLRFSFQLLPSSKNSIPILHNFRFITSFSTFLSLFFSPNLTFWPLSVPRLSVNFPCNR